MTSELGEANIVLTGFMGTGKTTVGRLLATRLDYGFVDTDAVIEERHGPIVAIFRDEGEAGFRAIERMVAADVARQTRAVIATGGRMMLDPANVRELTRRARVFCLVATPDEILERITADAALVERPLLAVSDPRGRIVELLAERAPGYGRFARVAAGGRPPDAVASELASILDHGLDRVTVRTQGGDVEWAIGAAILPSVRRVAGIDGPFVIVADGAAGDRHLDSCPSADLVVTLPSGPTTDSSPEAIRHVVDALAAADIDPEATILSLGDHLTCVIASEVASARPEACALVHCPIDLAAMLDLVACEPETPSTHGGSSVRPTAVVADVATAQSPGPAFAAGMAGALRLGLLAGPELVDRIEARDWQGGDLGFVGSLGDVQGLVAHAVEVAAHIAGGDGARRASLDLGQPFARVIEQTDTGLLRGEALGLGLLAAARLSADLGHCDPELPRRIERLATQLGLPIRFPLESDAETVASAVRSDGQRRIVLLHAVGRPFEVSGVADSIIDSVLEGLRP